MGAVAIALAVLLGADNGPEALYRMRVTTLEGKELALSSYRGRVLLIVNSASACEQTPQYAQLEALHRRYRDRGLTVLAFPCNDFGGQEPKGAKEIRRFCTLRYDVTFPIMAKVRIAGAKPHPLFRHLIQAPKGGEVKWNFTKFLVGRDGEVAARFEPWVEPESEEVVGALERLLGPTPDAGR